MNLPHLSFSFEQIGHSEKILLASSECIWFCQQYINYILICMIYDYIKFIVIAGVFLVLLFLLFIVVVVAVAVV